MTGRRLCEYVGPDEIRLRVQAQPIGRIVRCAGDVCAWITETNQETDAEGLYRATFIIDQEGKFRVEDYGYEHVAWAGGGPVLSAGVAWFALESDAVSVETISNQSTGFCPEPASWPSVETALDAADIQHPGRFTQEIVFRRCQGCGQRNIVKDEWYHCGVCDRELPEDWNFASDSPGRSP